MTRRQAARTGSSTASDHDRRAGTLGTGPKPGRPAPSSILNPGANGPDPAGGGRTRQDGRQRAGASRSHRGHPHPGYFFISAHPERAVSAVAQSVAQGPNPPPKTQQTSVFPAHPERYSAFKQLAEKANAPPPGAFGFRAAGVPVSLFSFPLLRGVGAPGGARELARLPQASLAIGRLHTPSFRDPSGRGGGGPRARGPLRGALRLPALQTRRHCRAPHLAPSSNAAIDDALDEQGGRMIRPVQGGGDNHNSENPKCGTPSFRDARQRGPGIQMRDSKLISGFRAHALCALPRMTGIH